MGRLPRVRRVHQFGVGAAADGHATADGTAAPDDTARDGDADAPRGHGRPGYGHAAPHAASHPYPQHAAQSNCDVIDER